MKKPMTTSPGQPASPDAVEQKLTMPMVWSIAGHLILCILFIGLPRFGTESRLPANIVNVQLVSVSAPSPEPTPAPEMKTPEPEKAPASAPEPKPAVTTASKPKEAVSLAPPAKIEKKRSMKKRTYKRERVMESAIKNAEKRVEDTRPDPIREALDKIEKNLKEEESQASAGKGEAGGGSGLPTSEVKLMYHMEVAFNIRKNWAFSDQIAGDETGLYNLVVIKIMRNGEIRDLWFDRRSGNDYLDESAKKAILKSSPLPPFPDGLTGSYIEYGFRFTPKGLN